MTFNQLSKIIKQNHIPKNVHLMSDSGWEDSEQCHNLLKETFIEMTKEDMEGAK